MQQSHIEAQPDVTESVHRHRLISPFEHFLKFGYKAGYRASPPLYSVEVPDLHGKAAYEKRCLLTTATRMTSGEKLVFPVQVERPQISCIVPVVDQGHMTLHLLEQLAGIAWRSDTPSIEVIVVDNGSTDLTLRLPEMVEGVTFLRSNAQLGYPEACNLGAEAAIGDVLLFMNNDVEVNAGSFRRGHAILADRAEVGAVGGRIVLMTGAMQEAGSVIFDDGSAQGVGRLSDPTLPRYNIAREVDYCSGCFLFVRRADFARLGGFDMTFSPGYYEEADLCFRLKAAGLATFFDPQIYVHHYEYASYSKGRPPTVSAALMQRNRTSFVRRHRDRLLHHPLRENPTWQAALLTARSIDGLNIALVEDAVPNRLLGSGFVRTADLLDTFLGAGHRVTVFALHNQPGSTRTAEQLRMRGVEVVECYRPDVLADPFKGREWDFDLVWICRTHNFLHITGQLRGLRAANPRLRVVLDTEAIIASREESYRKLRDVAATTDLSTAVTDELSTALQPNAVVVVNDLDARAAELSRIGPVFILGHRMTAAARCPGVQHRAGVLFFGAFHLVASPNYDSIRWFLQEIWPEIRWRRPDETFRIAGAVGPGVDIAALIGDSPGVEYLGNVPDLGSAIDGARLFVAPTRYAGGIPHKVHEAMASGLPVVATDLLRGQLATSDFGFDDVPILSAGVKDAHGFAERCIDLLEDDALWQDMQIRALAFIERTASSAIFRNPGLFTEI